MFVNASRTEQVAMPICQMDAYKPDSICDAPKFATKTF